MASTPRAPKQWCLTKNETVTSFENWRQNLIYTLSLDKNIAPFLVADTWWAKKRKTTPYRGFSDDDENIPEANRLTKEQKVNMLELLLGQFANYCQTISRNTIVNNSTSIDQIWQTIRLHYGFQTTGAHFIDFDCIRFDPTERPEDLFQRLTAFVEDNLLRKNMGITHHNETIEEDEELCPSLENVIVLTWLRLLYPGLPKLVKQRYGMELRARTLASIKPEISQALESLLEELRTSEDAKSMRILTNRFQKPQPKSTGTYMQNSSRPKVKLCPLCKTANRPDRHYLSKCPFLPSQDRNFIAKARAISDIFEQEDHTIYEATNSDEDHQPIATSRIQVRQSPYFDVYLGHHPVRLTIDSGATGNMIRASTATYLNAEITRSSQSAYQADGSSPLKVIGETRLTFVRDNHKLYFEGLVVENLDSEVLAGIPFMENNDIAIRPSRCQVLIGNDSVYQYQFSDTEMQRHAVRRTHIVRAPSESTTLWPGEFVEVELPSEMAHSDSSFAVEPHPCSSEPWTDIWPTPSLLQSVAGKLRIPNLTNAPRLLKRNEHFCKVRTTHLQEKPTASSTYTPKSPVTMSHSLHSDLVQVDPDNMLCDNQKAAFRNLLIKFDDVFNPNFKGYNSAVGPLDA